MTIASDSTGVVTIDNAGTFVVQEDGAALTALQIIDNTIVVDDAAFTPATTSVSMIGATFDDTTPDSIDEGDAGAVRMSANRNLYVRVRDDAGNERGLNIDANGEVGVTNAGTFVVQEDGAALTALQLIDDPVFADDAAFTLTSSKVSMSGAIRDDALSTLAAVEGDAVPLRVGSTGALHVTGGGGGTEYNEDDATPSPIVGTATLIERDDILTTVTPIEGDFIALRGSAEGALWVQDFNSDAILTDTNTIAGAVTGTEMQVDVITMPTTTVDWAGTAPPIGAGVEATALRVTVATDSTGVLSIDDNGGSLTVDNGGTFATQATLQANSGVDIGDVDITSQIPGTGATNLGKAQDTAGGVTDTGVAILAIRDDEQAAMTPIDGDYSTLRTDRFGNLKVTQLPDATSEVKYAIIDAALSGDNTIQAAAGAGIKIRVLSAFLVSSGTVIARFESGASGTALTGQMNLVVNSGFTLPYNPAGWFETADNALLNLELSAAVSVDGCITYVEV